MDSDDFLEIISAMEDWALRRTLVKGETIFPTESPRLKTTLSAIEIETSEFLPEGMDWFVLRNTNRVVMRPSYQQRLKAFIDDFAAAADLQTVA